MNYKVIFAVLIVLLSNHKFVSGAQKAEPLIPAEVAAPAAAEIVNIKTVDGQRIPIAKEIALQSNVIKTMQENSPKDTDIPVLRNNTLLRPMLEAMKFAHANRGKKEKELVDLLLSKESPLFDMISKDPEATLNLADFLEIPIILKPLAYHYATLVHNNEKLTEEIKKKTHDFVNEVARQHFLRYSTDDDATGKVNIYDALGADFGFSIQELLDYGFKFRLSSTPFPLAGLHLKNLEGLNNIMTIYKKNWPKNYFKIAPFALNLTHNQLTSLGKYLQEIVPSIAGLELSYNKINILGSSLQGLNNLSNLELNNNQLSSPEDILNALSNLPKLSTLKLKENPIKGDKEKLKKELMFKGELFYGNIDI